MSMLAPQQTLSRLAGMQTQLTLSANRIIKLHSNLHNVWLGPSQIDSRRKPDLPIEMVPNPRSVLFTGTIMFFFLVNLPWTHFKPCIQRFII
jgi:hypothetical protein